VDLQVVPPCLALTLLQYAQISTTHPDLASQSALSQESEISSSSPTLSAYKTAIHHSAVSISRRPPPDSVPHPSIGTVRESREAHLAAEKAAAGRLTRDKVSRYCLPLDDFVDWGYPDPKDQTLVQGGGEDPDGEGSTQTCDRCKVPFVVSSENLQARFGECRYHYGRTAPARVEGRRKWIYSCCGKERGEAGCEDGVHVFSHKEDGADAMLAKRQGFRTVNQVAEEVGSEKIARGAFVEVVGMDCEMICEWGGDWSQAFSRFSQHFCVPRSLHSVYLFSSAPYAFHSF
jgi:RNA exonuclease 1